MAANGSDIVFSLSDKANAIILHSASGASIQIGEVDAGNTDPLLATTTTVMDLISNQNLDNDGAAGGSIDPGNAETFSGHVTYTSQNGPIIFGHKETGTNVLEMLQEQGGRCYYSAACL